MNVDEGQGEEKIHIVFSNRIQEAMLFFFFGGGGYQQEWIEELKPCLKA